MPVTQVADDSAQAALDLNAGFNLETPPEQTAKLETPAKIEAKPEAKVETKVAPKPDPVEPKYVQITQEQFDTLQSAASKTGDLEKQLSKAFGTMGDMQQIVKKLQAATPAGMSIDIPADAFAEMENDFPELAAQLRKGLEKTLKNVRGTAPETEKDKPAVADPEAVQTVIRDATIRNEIEALEDVHPTWREIVGTVDAEGKHDPNNAFRKWLATQDVGYQQKINGTNSATVIARAIDKFLAAKKAASLRPSPKPAPKIAARVDRIKGAIQPKGDGGQPSAPKTAADDFQEGFRTG